MQRLDTCRLKLGFELFPPSAASLFPDASLLNLNKIDREETQLEIETVTSLSLLGRISFLATRESLKFVIVIYFHLRACSPYEGDASFRNFVGELGQTIGIHLLVKIWDVISLHDQTKSQIFSRCSLAWLFSLCNCRACALVKRQVSLNDFLLACWQYFLQQIFWQFSEKN